MGTREHGDLAATRDLAVGVRERLVEARAEINLEIGDRRYFDGRGQLQGPAGRFLARVDAKTSAATRVGQFAEQRQIGIAANSDGEQARARRAERAAQTFDDLLAIELTRRSQPITNVNDRRLLGAVQTLERNVEQGC